MHLILFYILTVFLINLIILIILKFDILSNHFIIFFSILVPFSFFIISLILIFIFNVILVKGLISYFRKKSNAVNGIELEELTSCIQSNQQNQFKKTQKLHYFTILISNIWGFLTSIPCYSASTILILLELKLISIVYNVMKIILKAQNFISIFFNSNHCINFL